MMFPFTNKPPSLTDKSDRPSTDLQHRRLVFISLSLGFLIIWTSVVAGVLLSNTISDNASAKETVKIFRTHEDVAKIVFALGHEMVSTVDWLVSNQNFKPKRSSNIRIDESIGITWKMSDVIIEKIKERSYEWAHGTSHLISLVEIKLAKFRGSSVYLGINPLTVIQFYMNLYEIIERKCFALDASMNGLVRRHLPMPSTAYALFIKGMAKRFAELALGTVYVRSDLPLNKTKFLELHYNSQMLIESAFRLNPRAQLRYLESQEQDPNVQQVLASVRIDMLSDGSRRGTNHFASAYLNSVKDEIALLLRAKDYINTSLSGQISHLVAIRHKVLAFHMSIALIAFLALFICLIFYCFSFKNFTVKTCGIPHLNSIYLANKNDDVKKNVYRVEYNDFASQLLLRSDKKSQF